MSESHPYIHQDEPLPEEHAELAGLADGSLEPERAAVLEARAATSLELSAALARQRQAVAILRDAAAATQAPLALRERLERDRTRLAAPRRRRRLSASPAIAGGLAAVALVAVMVGLSSGPGAPSVAEAAALADRLPVAAAPAAGPGTPQLLAVEESGVAFPNWERRFGWKAVGRRTDELGGRSATTVFYVKGAERIAYTIVSGAALGAPASFATVRFGGVDLQVFAVTGRAEVTWLREGHTCVMSATGVATATLLELATWKGHGALAF